MRNETSLKFVSPLPPRRSPRLRRRRRSRRYSSYPRRRGDGCARFSTAAFARPTDRPTGAATVLPGASERGKFSTQAGPEPPPSPRECVCGMGSKSRPKAVGSPACRPRNTFVMPAIMRPTVMSWCSCTHKEETDEVGLLGTVPALQPISTPWMCVPRTSGGGGDGDGGGCDGRLESAAVAAAAAGTVTNCTGKKVLPATLPPLVASTAAAAALSPSPGLHHAHEKESRRTG
jgi:hypothetical protein